VAPRRKVSIQVPVTPGIVVANEMPGEEPYRVAAGLGRQLLPSVTLTAADFDVDLTNHGQMPRPGMVKIGNLSPWLLQVSWLSHADMLCPGEYNVFPTMGATRMHVHPVAITDPVPDSDANQMVMAVAPEGVTFPGTYPALYSQLGESGYGFGSVLVLQDVTTVQTGSFTIPAGTESLSIITVVPAGNVSSLGLTGATSGFGYYGDQFGSGAYEIIGVDASSDTVLDYTASASGPAPGVSWFISALPTPPPSFVQRLPAPWQAPTTPAAIDESLPVTSTFDWITPPSGRSLRMFSGFLHWQTSTRGFGEIKGSGSTGAIQHYDQVATNFLEMNYGGFKMAVNEKFQITNDDTGVGKNVNGYVMYSLD
jgi:hypothetical protein